MYLIKKGEYMSISGIKVLFISKSWDISDYQTETCNKLNDLICHIARFMPDVIVTSKTVPGQLNLAGLELRKKWIHVDEKSTNKQIIKQIENCYSFNLWNKNPNELQNPLISVYTGTYNTGDYLRDTYQSLREQTYTNWEWVVVDDESTDGTWERILEIAQEDYRVKPFRMKHNGKIGNTKDVATRLANGEYVVELDHDDMLTDFALDEIKKAFVDPEVGMVYSNCASFFTNGNPHQFNDNFWKDRYRDTEYRGKTYKECLNPDIYDRFGPNHQQQFGWFLTVGPNHVRCYRTNLLREFGGYNRNIPVADDWDVFARFFLRSKCVHINKMLYLYRFHDAWQNTTFTRNKSIQDHMTLGRWYYNQEFINFNCMRERQSKETLQTKTSEIEILENLSIIVLDYNTQEITTKCLDSIKKHYPHTEIILIQNGKHWDHKHAKTVKLETNIGFAAGCNRGILETNKKYVCFLNSDTIVEPNLFEPLLEQISQPDIGLVGPYTNKARPPQGYYEKQNYPNTNILTNSITGFCMMIEKELFNELGGFDVDFCNFEDDDLCRKVRDYGLKCAIANCWVHHDEHSSFKANNIDVEDKIETSKKLFEKKWPKIRVVALTLNEIDCLPGFVEQYRGIADDFAILDSGSTDGTLEWAEKNGVLVEHRKFDNFSDQRNAAIELFGDTDWIIMHDPDERLDGDTIANLRSLALKDYDIYLSPLRSENLDGSHTRWVAKPFLFKSDSNIKWVFPVHEKLIGSMKQATIKNAMITHYLELHDTKRRNDMSTFYDSLGHDETNTCDGDWPILNYKNRDDERIHKIVLGPLVSVIVPTYNRKDLLNLAINSINSQDYINKEIIIIGDNCPEFKEIDGCRCVNLPENHGAGGAVPRNYGIMLANGKWIAYLDDDNQWEPNHISSLVPNIIQTDSDFGFSSLSIDGKILKCLEPVKGKIDTSAVIHKKELIKCGWWKDRLEDSYSHDFAFFNRFIKAGCSWVATGKPTVIYNKDTSGQKEYLENLIAGL